MCRYGDHYKWDKVTTCVYNIMSGERSVDHYGTMKIVNKDTCYCKVTFYKVCMLKDAGIAKFRPCVELIARLRQRLWAWMCRH